MPPDTSTTTTRRALLALAAAWASPTWAQTSPAEAAPAAAALYQPPPSARIAYEVDGLIGGSSYSGNAELVWTRDGKNYQTQLLIRKFGLTLQAWTSAGRLTARGLEPETFSSQKIGQAEIFAYFERDANRIRFSAGTPAAPLQRGAQDQLSVFMQLASLLGGAGTSVTAGKAISMQAIGDRYAEQWSFHPSAPETVKLPSGTLQAIKLTHEPTAERKQRLELWYAPTPHYVPVRIRITEANGDYLDLVGANTQFR